MNRDRMNEKADAIVRYLKPQLKKKTKMLFMCGEFCNKILLGDKKLLEYIIPLASKTEARVAATGSTVVELRRRGVKAKKMFAAEILFHLNDHWSDALGEKPEVVLLMGYNAAILNSIVSALQRAGVDTIVLDTIEIEEAAYSLHGLTRAEWKASLEAVIKNI